jgi:hypothetical protein
MRKFCVNIRGEHEGAARNGIVGHFLPCPSASGLARAGRHEADRFHFVGPFPVMIAGARRVAEMELPCVDHFMRYGLEDFEQGDHGEICRVDGDFVGLALVVMMHEPFR